MDKVARPINLPAQGSMGIEQALQLYAQAQLLARPSKQELSSHELSEKSFGATLDRITQGTHPADPKFNFSALAPDVNMNTALGALLGVVGGGALGTLVAQGDHKIDDALIGAALGGASGGAYGHLDAKRKRKNMLNTAKLLKSYGLLNPSKFHKARPLLQYDFD